MTQQETGVPVTWDRLLGYIQSQGRSWLHDVLKGNPEATCSCGSCHLCFLRFAEAQKVKDGETQKKLERLREGIKKALETVGRLPDKDHTNNLAGVIGVESQLEEALEDTAEEKS